MGTKQRCVVLALVLSGAVLPVFAQSPAVVQAPAVTPIVPSAEESARNDKLRTLSALPKSDADYRLGPGDLIEISVFGVDSLRQTIRLSAAGVVKLPLLEPVEAAGLTPAELEARLTKMLDGDIVKNPQVSVFIKEYRSQLVHVLGAVRLPGQYQITVQLRIVDVLSLAGGLAPAAGDEVTIQRKSADGGEEVLRVSLIDLLERSDLSRNIPVKGGDVVNVPERLPESAFVLGEVNRAGAFPLSRKQNLRVTQLLALAGGPMKTAKLKNGILVRYSEQTGREEIPMNFADILSGKKEDFIVRNNDVIFVPGSNMKTLGYGALNAIPGTLLNLFWLLP